MQQEHRLFGAASSHRRRRNFQVPVRLALYANPGTGVAALHPMPLVGSLTGVQLVQGLTEPGHTMTKQKTSPQTI